MSIRNTKVAKRLYDSGLEPTWSNINDIYCDIKEDHGKEALDYKLSFNRQKIITALYDELVAGVDVTVRSSKKTRYATTRGYLHRFMCEADRWAFIRKTKYAKKVDAKFIRTKDGKRRTLVDHGTAEVEGVSPDNRRDPDKVCNQGNHKQRRAKRLAAEIKAAESKLKAAKRRAEKQ